MSSEKKLNNEIEKFLHTKEDDEILDLDLIDDINLSSNMADSSVVKDDNTASSSVEKSVEDTIEKSMEEITESLKESVGRINQASSKSKTSSNEITSKDENSPKVSTSNEIAKQVFDEINEKKDLSEDEPEAPTKAPAPKAVDNHSTTDDFSDVKVNAPSNKKRSNKKRIATQRTISNVITIILACTTLASLLLCTYLIVFQKPQMTEATSEEVVEEPVIEEVLYNQEQVDALLLEAKEQGASEREIEIKDYIRSMAEVKNPNFAEMLRRLYTDNVVYFDTDGYHFVPINESLGLHDINSTQLFTDGAGNYTYVEDSVVTSTRGIDVSQHQGVIDWQQVADSGIDFVILRVGFRGYGSGALVEDEQFVNNIQGATEAGLDVGVYFFTQAINAEEAVEEAQFVLDAIAPYNITGPVAIDVEKPDDNSARGNALSAVDRTGYVKLFCQAIEKEGYTPMIYGNTYSMFAMLDISQLTNYPKWYAFYNNYLYYPYELDIWQYSAGAEVPGIKGDVDINIWFH